MTQTAFSLNWRAFGRETFKLSRDPIFVEKLRWMLSTRGACALARDFVETCAQREAISPDQLPLHADRGSPMRSKTFNELLLEFGIEASFSRPHQNNDNPFGESLFKTTKYSPTFPACFTSLDHARDVLAPFSDHYNYQHRHSCIGPMTPAAVHRGQATATTTARALTLNDAFARHPQRF